MLTFGRFQNAGMFDLGRNNCFPHFTFDPAGVGRAGKTVQNGVGGFTAASDENDFIRRGSNEIRDCFARLFDFLPHQPAGSMQTGGITIILQHLGNDFFYFRM
jgi:hypothetical protein